MKTIYADDCSVEWRSSVEKWVGAVVLSFSHNLRDEDVRGECGFCKQIIGKGLTCEDNCPLVVDYCDSSPSNTDVYGDLLYILACLIIDWERVQLLTQAMLNEILCNEF